MVPTYHIHISNDLRFPTETELFPILERLLPVKFIFDNRDGDRVAGEIIAKGMVTQNAAVSIKSTPSLSLPSSVNLADEARRVELRVKFSDDPDVPFPFRGRVVSTKLGTANPILSLRANEKILATSELGPIWSVCETGAIKHFRSALPLPQILSNQNFSDLFNGGRFLEMLVLLQFLRAISVSTVYQNAPLRAAFIVDDPNLHWPQYGFVDYRKIITHAIKENYHVSFATIPIDTWFTHAKTADLFRRNSKRLSLLIHGNNHAKEELARNYSEATRRNLLHQAIWRIERLEQKANFQVCRVMVPPHGACSDKMLAELPKCGFEAACISANSLRAHNQSKSWTKTLGFSPAEIIDGCPVLPRWGLTGNTKNMLLIAAYLGQPMILRLHHQDLKDGVEVLDEYARFINGLGNIFWLNMTSLSRLNYLWRMEGTTYRVKPLGSNIIFKLPSDATEIIVENNGAIGDGAWQVVSVDGSLRRVKPGEQFFLSEAMGREISLERAGMPEHGAARMGFKLTSPGLIVRRLLTEARDRFFHFHG